MIKRGQASMWIGVILVVIFIITIIVLVVVFLNKKIDVSEDENKIKDMKLFLRGVDESNSFIGGSYMVETLSGNIIAKGNFSKDSFTEIKVPREKLKVSCWNKDSYVSQRYKTFLSSELIANNSREICELRQIGDIKIKSNGEFIQKDSTIEFNISSNDLYKRLSATISWTPGILTAYFKNDDMIICRDGLWLDYSSINQTTQELTLLEQKQYRCGECFEDYCSHIELCEEVDGRRCFKERMNIPQRFIGLVDEATYFGEDIDNGYYTTELYIKSSYYINRLDYVEVTFFDQDQRYNPNTQKWDYQSEKEGVNLGNKEDKKIKIYYNG